MNEKIDNNKKGKKKKSTTKKVEKKEKVIVEEEKEEKELKNDNKKTNGFFLERYSIFDLLFFLIIAVIISVLVTSTYMNKRIKSNALLNTLNNIRDKEVNEFVTTYNEIVDNYYEDINKEELVSAAIDGMTSYLDENYTDYLTKEETKAFNESLKGTYKGIGIELKINEIVQVFKNSPAEEIGLQVGDIVKSMDGYEINEENFGTVFGEIDISKKKSVTVIVERDGKESTYDVEVKKIDLPIVTNNYIELDDSKIGYIKISSFTKNSPKQFKNILEELEKKGITKLIVDVRNNNGGYLDSAEEVISMFLKKGDVMYSVENKNGKEKVLDKTKEEIDYKIVVLINGASASSSEIFAAALRDNKNAIIVGEKSFGKGRIQNTKELSDGSLIKYTRAKWYTPNGEYIDEVGITPNYEVTNEDDKDLQYDKALELLK